MGQVAVGRAPNRMKKRMMLPEYDTRTRVSTSYAVSKQEIVILFKIDNPATPLSLAAVQKGTFTKDWDIPELSFLVSSHVFPALNSENI